jgi:hypothetical protein
MQHLFQTKGLGAKLNLIPIGGFRLATLVLHRIWPPTSLLISVKLHHIRLAGQAKAQGTQGQSGFDPNTVPAQMFATIHPLMHDAALSGEHIFRPDLLDMDQGALPLTEQQMLQSRERQQIVLGIYLPNCSPRINH